jgi:SAM-dependent methyltransferase
MSIFGDYSGYYNLLYRDKDYNGEAGFIDQLIQAHSPSGKSILDLGCGTGIHAALLVARGYHVCGVDSSQGMIREAELRLLEVTPELVSRLNFFHGDIRHIRLNQKFDVVISLFHVMSYQTTNEDIAATFATMKEHLKPGGIIIFDCWYGPAVLSDRPVVRVKRLENDDIAITRIAEPVMHPNENRVDVHYHVFVRDKRSGVVEELRETHCMRYLFQPETAQFMNSAGLTVVVCKEWMSDRIPGFDTWGVYFIGRDL